MNTREDVQQSDDTCHDNDERAKLHEGSPRKYKGFASDVARPVMWARIVDIVVRLFQVWGVDRAPCLWVWGEGVLCVDVSLVAHARDELFTSLPSVNGLPAPRYGESSYPGKE